MIKNKIIGIGIGIIALSVSVIVAINYTNKVATDKFIESLDKSNIKKYSKAECSVFNDKCTIKDLTLETVKGENKDSLQIRQLEIKGLKDYSKLEIDQKQKELVGNYNFKFSVIDMTVNGKSALLSTLDNDPLINEMAKLIQNEFSITLQTSIKARKDKTEIIFNIGSSIKNTVNSLLTISAVYPGNSKEIINSENKILLIPKVIVKNIKLQINTENNLSLDLLYIVYKHDLEKFILANGDSKESYIKYHTKTSNKNIDKEITRAEFKKYIIDSINKNNKDIESSLLNITSNPEKVLPIFTKFISEENGSLTIELNNKFNKNIVELMQNIQSQNIELLKSNLEVTFK